MLLLLLNILLVSNSWAAQKFVVHGNSLVAYKNSGAGNVSIPYVPGSGAIPAVVADASSGCIGGFSILHDGGGGIRGSIYPGFSNSQKTGQISILHRFSPTYSGAPSSNQSLIDIAGPSTVNGTPTMLLQVVHLSGSGNITTTLTNSAANSITSSNQLVSSAWSPVAGTYYDLVVTWDGTGNAGSLKYYLDGVLLAALNPGRPLSADANQNVVTDILIGSGHNSIFFGDYKSNEYVLWDTTIDPTGSGLNLNGNARTSFVTVTGTLDPTLSTDPGIANVSNGVGYTINGIGLTGNVVSPATSNVKIGITYGSLSSLTGIYTGSDRWTDPGISNVRQSIPYTANAASLVGTLNLPAVSDVKLGVTFDNGNSDGTLTSTDPGVGNVLLGVPYQINSVSFVGSDGRPNTILHSATLRANGPFSDTPSSVTFSQGDDIQVDLFAEIGTGVPFDITGATFTTNMLSVEGSYATFDNTHHVVVSASNGWYRLSASSAETPYVGVGQNKDVITTVIKGGKKTSFRGRILNVFQQEPIQ